MLFGGLITAVVHAFHPAWWAFLYQMPTGFVLAYLLARPQARDSVSDRAVLWVALMVGVGGALVFFLSLGLGASFLTLLLAIAIMWVGTSFALDKYLDVDWESSQRITGLVCGPIRLVWLILGAVVGLVR